MNIARLMQEAAANAVAWDLNKLAFNGGDINWGVNTALLGAGDFGIRFKPDGTLLLAPGTFFLDLASAWDVSDLTLNNGANTEDDVYVKADGSAYFTIDGLSVLRQYSLSPVWDFDNGTSTLINSVDLTSTTGVPRGLEFKSDGTKFYVSDPSEVHEFSMSSAWDISTATFVQSFTYTQGATSSHGNIRFKPDGTEFFVAFTGEVHKYTLSSAWDISTSSYDSTFTAPSAFYTEGSETPSIDLKPDGTQLFLAYGAVFSSTTPLVGRVFNVDLGTPWDLSTASYTTPSSDFVNFSFNNAQGLFFKPDGTKLYVVRNNTSTTSIISEYSLSLAWDITTATFSASGSVAAARGIYISPDGTNLYFTRDSNDSVYQYSMSSAWDISSLSLVRTSSVSSQTTTPIDVTFKPDGTKMYITTTQGPFVYEYDLSTPWNISTKTFVQSTAVPGVGSDGVYSIYMRADGGAAYFLVSDVSNITSELVEAKLTTPWDVSTMDTELILDIKSIYVPRGLSFKGNGKKMYVLSVPYTRILSFDL